MQYRVMRPTNPIELTPEVEVRGVDFGKRPLLWEVRRQYLVLKISGGMHWSGRGETRYGAAYFQVCKIIETLDDHWLVEEAIDFPLRQK